MKRNGFGEAYCTSADELQDEIERKVMTLSSVYATVLSPPAPEDKGRFGWTIEIAENESGDTVCFAMADTEAKVREMLTELGIKQP